MRSIAIVALALGSAGIGGNAPASAQDQEPPRVEIVRDFGHSDPISALAFSPDGKTLATGSKDYTVKLWNVATGLLLRTIGGQPYEVKAVAFTADGTEVISVSDLLHITINVSDAATGVLKRAIDNPELAKANLLSGEGKLALSADGSMMALALRGSTTPTIDVIDTRTGASIYSVSTVPDVHLAFSPDGRYLAATGDDCGLTLLDPVSRERVSQLACGSFLGLFGTAPKFDAMAFSGDGRTISAFAKTKLTRFDVASATMLSEVDTGHDLSAVAVSPDGTMVATASSGIIEIWDATGTFVRKVDGHSESGSLGRTVLAFAPNDGAVLATGGGDALVRLWDAKDWTSARSLQGVKSAMGGVAITADGARIAVDGWGRTILWDAHEGRFVRQMEDALVFAGDCATCSIGFSSDGRLLAAGTRKATTQIWDIPSGRIVTSLTHSSEDAVIPRRSVAFLPDSSAVVLGAMSEGREPTTTENDPVIYDFSARKVVHFLTSEPHTYGTLQWTYPMAVAADGKLIAAASRDNVINIFDSQSGQIVRSVRGANIASNGLAFSADGRFLASASNDYPTDWIEMWDVATGTLVQKIPTQSKDLLSIAFSPDNRVLASAGDDRVIALWNPDDGTRIGSLVGHDAAVSSLAFSKNGTLVSGSQDGSLKIWSSGSLDLLATMIWEPTGEWMVFTPEGFFEAEGRANKLAVVRGLEAYPIDAAYDLLHRPDLVREKLNGDPLGQVKAAAAQLDLWTVVSPH